MSFSSGKNEEMQQALLLALKDGEVSSSSATFYVLGDKSVGKTCLVATLLGEVFGPNECYAAIAEESFDVSKVFASKWCRLNKEEVSTALQKKYYSKLKMTAQIKISADQQQPNCQAQNKQQLESLPKAVQADLEQAKTAVLIDDDSIDAIIWDCSYQSVSHGLHSIFLKENGVAMIVFDASKFLEGRFEGRHSNRNPYTQKSSSSTSIGCERVCHWLQSVHSICHKDGRSLGATSTFVPTVFLVATHIDQIAPERLSEDKKKIIDHLFYALKDQPFVKHLAGFENGLRVALEESCFFISNKVRNIRDIDRLCAALVKASCYLLNRQHPVVFLNIEKNLLSRNKTAISTKEFHSIAWDSGFLAKFESAEFKGLLAAFNQKGAIVSFLQSESLKDLVVVSPNWLTMLFAYVIVGYSYQVEFDHNLQFQRLRDHGILEEDFITFMVSKFNKEQNKSGLSINTKLATDCARLFEFIVEVSGNIYFLEEKNYSPPVSSKRAFIVPSMLPLELPDSADLPEDKDPQARVVYFKFSEEFIIPPFIYYYVVGACIDRNIERQENMYW